MRTIKLKKDLPDWFIQRKYKNNLTLLDWYYEIQWRLYCMELAKSPDLLEHAKGFWAKSPDREDVLAFSKFRNPPPSPIADFTQFNLAFAYFHEFENPHTNFYKQDNLKQHLEYLLSKYSHKDGEKHQAFGYPLYFDIIKKQIQQEKKVMHKSPPTGWWLYNDMFCGEHMGMDGFPITVNLHYDDSYLIEQFKQWLAVKREKDKKKPRLSEKNKISDRQISQWALGNYRQLIDLDYWAKLEKVKIAEDLMISTIWPNDTAKTKESLKETRRQYRKVFHFRTRERLTNQIKMSKLKETSEG